MFQVSKLSLETFLTKTISWIARQGLQGSAYTLIAGIACITLSSQAVKAADTCLANPDWGIIITDHGYSDVLMDLRIVDGVSYRGREYLSGEYAHAVAYMRDGVPVAPIWLEPEFIFPDWTTNSNFTVVTPNTMIGPNGQGLPVMESVIENADLRIRITSEMIDNGSVGIQNGMTPESSASVTVGPITSNKYVMVQRYEYTNISGVPITDVNIVQMIHGLVSLVSLKDDRPYPAAGTDPFGFDASFVHDTTVIGRDDENGSFADPVACIPGSVAGATPSNIEHFDVLTFHTSAPPAAIDSAHYGDRDAGDSHVTGKPGIGTHINIETGAMNGSDFFDPGDGDYPPDVSLTPSYGDTDPADFWVAGAQAHTIGDMLPTETLAFDYLLSLQTASAEIPPAEEVNIPIPVGFIGLAGILLTAVYSFRRRELA